MRPDGQSSCGNHGWLSPGVAWRLPTLAPRLAPHPLSTANALGAGGTQRPHGRHRPPISAADVARVTPIARRVAGDHNRGRQVTGSMTAPTMHPKPTAAQTAPGRVPSSRCRALAAVMTAATGIGHGAATPAPHPASSPAGTDRGILTPAARREADHGPPPRCPARPRPRRRATRPAAHTVGPPTSHPPSLPTPDLRLAPTRSKPEAGKTIDYRQHHRTTACRTQPNQKCPRPQRNPAAGRSLRRRQRHTAGKTHALTCRIECVACKHAHALASIFTRCLEACHDSAEISGPSVVINPGRARSPAMRFGLWRVRCARTAGNAPVVRNAGPGPALAISCRKLALTAFKLAEDIAVAAVVHIVRHPPYVDRPGEAEYADVNSGGVRETGVVAPVAPVAKQVMPPTSTFTPSGT